MGLMNLNLDGVLTVEKVVVPADGITVLGHSLFRGEKIIVRYNGDELTRGQDFIPDRIDDRLYFQKNVCLFTILKILNESLFGKEIEVEYFACGDYIKAEIWNEYPSAESLKLSLQGKVDNSDYKKDKDKINADIAAEVNARIAGDDSLQENLNTEKELRIAADDDLLGSINNEAGTRKTADDNLQAAINTEATDRQSADSAIRADLENETNLRLVGDSNLQTQISDLKTKFESFVPGLTYKVVSALPTADILNDVIYLVPADSTGSQSVYDEYIYIDGNWELIGTTATTQAITVDSALSETSTNPVQNKVITTELKNMGRVYTSLAELGLTAPVTVGEIFNAMPDKTMAVIACEGKEGNTEGADVHVSDVPVSYGVLTIKKNEKGRFSIEYQNSLQGATCDVKRWIGTLKGNDGTGLYWKRISSEPTFTYIQEIGLTADATFQDVIDKLPKGSSAILGVKDFTNYQTIFPYEEGNDQFARVYIVKGVEDGSCMYARWFRKDGSKEAIAIFNTNNNKFDGWKRTGADNSAVITSNIITKYGTEILKYPVGTWRIATVNIANQFTDLPLKDMGSVIEIDSIDPNRSPYENSYGYRHYIFKASLDGIIYVRTLNSGDTAGTLQRDTGWKKIQTSINYSTTEQAVGTWIDGSTVYRKVFIIDRVDAQTTEADVEICNLGFNTQKRIIKLSGSVNSIGNEGVLPYAYYPNGFQFFSYLQDDSVYFKGTWKYPLNSVRIIVEYIK